jgi:uncharacterized membrane protein YhaH (DUF805 family)
MKFTGTMGRAEYTRRLSLLGVLVFGYAYGAPSLAEWLIDLSGSFSGSNATLEQVFGWLSVSLWTVVPGIALAYLASLDIRRLRDAGKGWPFFFATIVLPVVLAAASYPVHFMVSTFFIAPAVLVWLLAAHVRIAKAPPFPEVPTA